MKLREISMSERTSIGKLPPWMLLLKHLQELRANRALVITPGEGETVMAWKHRVTRAAKYLGIEGRVRYMENPDGELEIWLEDGATPKRLGVGRGRKHKEDA